MKKAGELQCIPSSALKFISGERGSANIFNLAKVEFDANSAKVQISRIVQCNDDVGLIDFDQFDVTQSVDLIVSRMSQEKTIQQFSSTS